MSKPVYNANTLDEEVGVYAENAEEAEKLKKEMGVKDDPEEEEEEEEESDDAPTGKKKDTEEEEESEEESEEEESEESEEEESEEEEEEEVDLDATIKDKFGEKYEIESMEQLEETLATLDEIVQKNEELEKELVEAKKAPKKPVFENKDQEKAYEFVKGMPANRQGEGLQTWAELTQMDVDNTDPKLALRAQYIIKHAELTREEASKKFEREYSRKYTVKPEEFDNDKEREEEEEMKKIDLKSDSAKAKEFLKKQQQEFKADGKADESKSEESEAVQEGMAETLKEATKYLDKYKHVTFSYGDDEFKYTLDEEKINGIRSAMTAWINNPAGYNKKGKLEGFETKKSTLNLTFALYGEDIVEKIIHQATNKASVKKIEEISGAKPNRKAKGGDATRTPRSEEAQWDEQIAAKEKAKKKR